MEQSAIFFLFPDPEAAELAFDTLDELGYEPAYQDDGGRLLHIHVKEEDLTSALEICQAHGGRLMEREDGLTDPQAFSIAYATDQIPVPAHTVNEDWPEEYAEGGALPTGNSLTADFHDLEPDQSFDHMSADVRV